MRVVRCGIHPVEANRSRTATRQRPVPRSAHRRYPSYDSERLNVRVRTTGSALDVRLILAAAYLPCVFTCRPEG
jgi:hypothetical protein